MQCKELKQIYSAEKYKAPAVGNIISPNHIFLEDFHKYLNIHLAGLD